MYTYECETCGVVVEIEPMEAKNNEPYEFNQCQSCFDKENLFDSKTQVVPVAGKIKSECNCDGSQYIIVDDEVWVSEDLSTTRIFCMSCKSTWLEPNF